MSTPIFQQHATTTTTTTVVHPPTPSPRPVSQPLTKAPSEEERWEVVNTSYDDGQLPHPQAPLAPTRAPSYGSLPPGASPPIPSPLAPRSPSPFGTLSNTPPPLPAKNLPANGIRERDKDQGTRRRPPANTAAGPLGILRALDPSRTEVGHAQPRSQSDEERYSHSDLGHRDASEKKERKGFWGTREKEKGGAHERDRSERGGERGRGGERREEDNQAELTRMIGLWFRFLCAFCCH